MIEVTDEFSHLRTLDDDTLYNVLQQTRIDLFCAEHDVGNVNWKRVDKLREKLVFVEEILEERGLNAHKQF
jgi:hypothetical protein